MKVLAFILGLAASLAIAETVPVSVTNELLTVNEKNEVSVPGVLATVSDLAEIQAQTEINAAKAEVAEEVYDDATNLLASVSKQLLAQHTVVYRKYFLESFTSVVLINAATDKVAIYSWTSCPGTTCTDTACTHAAIPSGKVRYHIRFGCTVDISSITPRVKSASTLNNTAIASWDYLDDQYVSGYRSISGSYTDGDGNVYNNLYYLQVLIPDTTAQFCVISLPEGTADSDGSTLVVQGGINGGITQTVTAGNLTITVTGGIITGVTDSGN